MLNSLKSKLLICVALVVIISNLSLGLVTRFISGSSITGLAEKTLDATAKKIAIQIDEINNREFRMLTTLSTLPYFRDNTISVEEKNKMLTATANIDKNYQSVVFFNKDGLVLKSDGSRENHSSRPYYDAAMLGKKTASNPEIVGENLIMFYCVPVFDETLYPCGGIVAVIKSERMSEIAGSMLVGKGSHPIIISMESGIIVGDSNIDNVKAKKNFLTESRGQLTGLIQKACNGDSGTAIYKDETGKKMSFVYTPVGDSCKWAVVCSVPYRDYFGALSNLIFAVIVTIAITVIIGLAVSTVFTSISLKPLSKVKSSINEIASGNADLSRRIAVNTKDEIGEVVKGFNKFTEKLQSIIRDVKASNAKLSNAGEELELSTENTNSSLAEILQNIDSIHGQISNQGSSVQQTVASVNQIASNIESLEHMIEKQNQGVSQASLEVQQMIGNIQAVNTNMDQMAASFEELSQNAKEGSAMQVNVNQKIEQIKQLSETLKNANIAIASIAGQTNLLAMNAAIEAAHAGEAGRGFSVVADEIRKLSETSGVQSKKIGQQIKDIQKSIIDVVSASEKSSAAFNSVSSKIEETDGLVRQIKAAMEEQNTGSRQIGAALNEMNDSTVEVRTASHQMSEGNKTILDEVRNLQDATSVMQQSMQEMSNDTRKINEASLALTGIARKMRESISDISGEISQFQA